MKERIIALAKKHRQLLLYGIIGMSGALIDVIFYYIFYHFLSIPPVVASYISVSMGIINNFFLNTRFNFKVTDHLLRRFGHFYLIGLAGALLSSLLIYIFYDLMGLGAFTAKLLTIVPVVLAQYIFNKRISFRDRSEPKPLDL
jgi:putative flippase GtrA